MEHRDTGQKGVKSGLQKILENEKWRKIIIIIGLAAIVLIFLSGFFKSEDSGSRGEVDAEQTVVSAEQYTQQLETSLTDLVSRIQGAGNAKVMVTLEKGTQYVYAQEEKKSAKTTENQEGEGSVKSEENSDSETTYILVKDSDGNQKALAVTELQPVVQGVVVVCEGGDSPVVQQNIINAVTVALNISSTRVCVIKSE